MKVTSELRHIYEIACRSDANVLITGPTGTGKTALARKIHEESSRRARPFVTVNLATLHEGTLESELFGHERGAFTGAEQRRVGKLEAAQGGTVFLDEIGDLSPRLQARLLEFLQSKTISPVGSNRELKLDVRVIAATHRNLTQLAAKGEFREDLFHRLRVLSIPLRPLAERWDEFDEIVHEVLGEACRAAGRSVLKISEGVARILETYPWPGNIRELKNVLEYSVLASDGSEIGLESLPSWFIECASRGGSSGALGESAPTGLLGVVEFPVSLDFHASISRFEKQFLELALKRYRGRINQTARQIGMNKTTLLRRIRAYNIAAMA